ncbi:MAG TPA: hypothetical protein VGL35_04270 [Rhizomicrobium sp.]|jgi:hypothetical protein
MSARWSAQRSTFAGGEKVAILRDGSAASFPEVIAGWQDSPECRAIFLLALSQSHFAAFFWEMPPIARGRVDIPYECVLIESRALACLGPDPDAFAAKFERTDETVAIFPNLGGDALLVVPRQVGEASTYAHLAAFVRDGPEGQKHDFLRVFGRAAEREILNRSGRVWISTSGLGVAWLHARLDSRPKYYQHGPYREC